MQLQRAKRSRLLWRSIAAACTALVVLAGFAELGSALAISEPLAAPDAIVTLGSHEWARLPLAARLARANPHAKLLLTMPLQPTENNCYRCADRVNLLARAGVSRKRIVILDSRVRNTYDEAAATFSYASTRGIHSVLVVTSPYHGRRALATFQKIFRGSPVHVGIETAMRESNAHPRSWWMSASDRTYVAYESAALVWYAAKYHVFPFPD